MKASKIQAELKQGQFIFNPNEHGTDCIQEVLEKGMVPVCYRCGALLAFALTPDEAREKHVPPGVHCPVNIRRCQVVVSFGDQQRIPQPPES